MGNTGSQQAAGSRITSCIGEYLSSLGPLPELYLGPFSDLLGALQPKALISPYRGQASGGATLALPHWTADCEGAWGIIELEKSRERTRAFLREAQLSGLRQVLLVGGKAVGAKTSLKRLGEALKVDPDWTASIAHHRLAAFDLGSANKLAEVAPSRHAWPTPWGPLALAHSPGTFGFSKPDRGSTLLIEAMKDCAALGRTADLAAGSGFLGLALLHGGRAEQVDAFEHDAWAVEDVRNNAEALGLSGRLNAHWWDLREPLPEPYPRIILNPPFHDHRGEDRGLGQAFIDLAKDRATQEIWCVTNTHLSYLWEGAGWKAEHQQREGFRITRLQRS